MSLHARRLARDIAVAWIGLMTCPTSVWYLLPSPSVSFGAIPKLAKHFFCESFSPSILSAALVAFE